MRVEAEIEDLLLYGQRTDSARRADDWHPGASSQLDRQVLAYSANNQTQLGSSNPNQHPSTDSSFGVPWLTRKLSPVSSSFISHSSLSPAFVWRPHLYLSLTCAGAARFARLVVLISTITRLSLFTIRRNVLEAKLNLTIADFDLCASIRARPPPPIRLKECLS